VQRQGWTWGLAAFSHSTVTPHVRPAVVADAPRLSRLAAATFRETFAGENTPEDMARYLADAFTPERQAAEIGDPGGTVLLAERRSASGDVELVGYAHLTAGPAPAAVRGPAPLELKRLYVARAWPRPGRPRSANWPMRPA
jgi:predicted cobalt transporter CbtA